MMIRAIATAYRTSFSGLSRETWLLSLVILINRCGYMAVPFMSMYVTQNLHRSITDAGLLITLFGIGAVAGNATSGYLTDRMGFRNIQIATASLSGLLFILFAQVERFDTLCIIIVVIGFIVEAFRPANLAAITAYAWPQTLTRSYALNRLAVNLGWGLGSAIGGILAAINYHLLFLVEGAVYLLVAGLILILLPAPDHNVNAAQPDTTALSAGRSPWKDAFAFRFFLLNTVYTTCFIMLFRLVPVYWKEHLNISENRIGMLLGLNGVIVALFEMVLIQRLQNNRPAQVYIKAGIVATALGFGLLLLPGIPALLLATIIVCVITVGEMMCISFMNVAFMRRANAQNRGKYAAAYTMCWSIGNIIGPLGGGILAEHFGYSVLWVVLVILCLSSAWGFDRLFHQQTIR